MEYLSSAQDAPLGIAGELRALGYRARAVHLPKGWWERNQPATYCSVCAFALAGGDLGEHLLGAPPWLWAAQYVVAYLSGGGMAAVSGFNSLRWRRIAVDFLKVAAALGAATMGDWAEGGMLLFCSRSVMRCSPMPWTAHAR